MREWFRGWRGGLIVYVGIAALIVGGLGWATAAALRLEQEQQDAREEAARKQEHEQQLARARDEETARLRLAMRRLDSRFAALLAREDGRPYNHYSPVYRPQQTLVYANARPWPDANVIEFSPLLNADLPPWMLLHFQAEGQSGWTSPEVIVPALETQIKWNAGPIQFRNVTEDRKRLLEKLGGKLKPRDLLAEVQHKGGQPTVPDRTTMLVKGNSQQAFLDSQQQGGQAADSEARRRFEQQTRVQNEINPQQPYTDNLENVAANFMYQGLSWFTVDPTKKSERTTEVAINLSPLIPIWFTVSAEEEYLLLVRQVQVAGRAGYRMCQGVVLDWRRMREELLNEVADLFPYGTLTPVLEEVAPEPERTMATLPFQFNPESRPSLPTVGFWPAPSALAPLQAGLMQTLQAVLPPEPGTSTDTSAASLVPPLATWTPLRIGLAFAWVAAIVALLAVGIGGWSLIDMSERRFRFVSAVSHELRTPLTTFRLYLDMLTSGMVKEEAQREEYLRTLHGEADRLGRLITNVLDYSKMERNQARLTKAPVDAAELTHKVSQLWQTRCEETGKQLVVEADMPPETTLSTDGEMVQQILGNLIDNACKYSQEAADPRIWLRVSRSAGNVCFEVEDCGPGVPPKERRTVFKAFRRGKSADAVGGGVGLGLALARRWASLLGGRLTLCSPPRGACFRLELPDQSA